MLSSRPSHCFSVFLGFIIFLSSPGVAQIPQVLSFQGRVTVDGANFDSATAGHAGLFKFVLGNEDGSVTYWSNDDTSVAGSEPTAAVSLTVVKGLYSVLLGDSSAGIGMTPIAPGVFAHPDVRLRVWFDDGVHGSQKLLPDQRIAAVGYAMVAGGVADGAVQSASIAAGAVDNTKLANPSITISAGAGLLGGGVLPLGGAITIENAGVLSLAGGGGITVSSATGSITIGSNATTATAPGTLVMRDASGNFSAGIITADLLGNANTATTALTAGTALSAATALNATNFSGLLAGDVSGTQGATVVGQVGGLTAALVAAGANAANTATALNTLGALVKRDANGDFSAGIITADLLGNASTATTALTALTALNSTNFSGPLAGDVTGVQGATIVAQIGGKNAAAVATGADAANTATDANTPDMLVKRDANGDFSAGRITAANFAGNGAALTGVPGTFVWQTANGATQAAAANTGYLADNPAQVTLTLPASAAVGDIVRVSGVGAGGWKIVPTATQSIVGFAAGQGPSGSQGTGTALQYTGNDHWQPTGESVLATGVVQSQNIADGAVTSQKMAAGSIGNTQLAAGAVQAANIAAGAVENGKLTNDSITISTGVGLAGGGLVALGNALTLSVPNGGIGSAQIAANAVDNTKLANPGLTLNTGVGLAGGGNVALGGALNLSIANNGIGPAQLAPGAALANLSAGGLSLGSTGAPVFAAARLLNAGTGDNKPELLFDRGITPKGRVTFQRSSSESGWSGLVFSINADWDDATGYAYDQAGRSQSIMQLEYEWLAPGGYRQNELNWTSSGRRIWAHYCRIDDSNKAGVAFLAPTAIIVPETDTTGAPPFQVEGFGDVAQVVLQNNNAATPAAAVQVVLRGVGSGGIAGPSTEWYLGTDRGQAGANNFYISQGLAGGGTRLFIDPAGKVGVNNVAPLAQLDVTGAMRASAGIQAGGTVDAAGFTVHGAPLQTVKHSFEFGGGQVHAMGNGLGSGYSWRSPVSLLNAFSPFGGSSGGPENPDADAGPFVPQLKGEASMGCVIVPRTWANGIQIKVRTWYCVKPGDAAGAVPNNAVVLRQGVWARSTPQNSVSQLGSGWDLISASSGSQAFAFIGGIDGEMIVDERIYTIPVGADIDTRQIRFGRIGPSPGDTESKDIYFVGISVEQL